MSKFELKPCPFCGKTNYLIVNESSHYRGDIETKQYTVVCDASGDNLGCGASCGFLENFTEQDAVEAWNSRAYLDSDCAEKEEMAYIKTRKAHNLEITGAAISEEGTPMLVRMPVEYDKCFCSECGEQVEMWFKFCPECGRKFERVERIEKSNE